MMKMWNALLVSALGAALVGTPVSAGAQQTTGEKIDQKTERTKDRVERGMDRAGDKAKQTSRDAGQAMKDTWVTSKAKIALFADDRVKGRQIEVETSNAVVTLRGKVDTDEAKQAASEVAQGVEGVQSVRNELQVVAPAQRDIVDAKDADITKAVEQRLGRDGRLSDVDVETNSGVVSLTGEVPSIGESARASQLAHNVPGVKAVKNDLTVERKAGRMTDRDGMMRGARTPMTSRDRMAGDRPAGATSSGNVKDLQQALKERGHDPGPIDGMMGPQTRAALIEFQKQENLTETGRLDPETASRLNLEGISTGTRRQNP